MPAILMPRDSQPPLLGGRNHPTSVNMPPTPQPPRISMTPMSYQLLTPSYPPVSVTHLQGLTTPPGPAASPLQST